MSRSRSPAAVSTDDELVLRRADGALGLGQLGVLRERATAVGEPVELAVDLGEIQQPPLDGGIGFHVMLPMLQGSVRRVETRTSTLPPNAARSTAAACAHHGHSDAQCATSTNAGAPGRSRCSAAGWWRRSAVT